MAKDKQMPLTIGDRVRINDGGTEIWTVVEVVATNPAGKFSVERMQPRFSGKIQVTWNFMARQLLQDYFPVGRGRKGSGLYFSCV